MKTNLGKTNETNFYIQLFRIVAGWNLSQHKGDGEYPAKEREDQQKDYFCQDYNHVLD